MTVADVTGRVGHVVIAVLAVLLLAYVCRRLARLMSQPEVIGEIVGGLLLGPALLSAGGPRLLDTVLPVDVFGWLKAVGQLGRRLVPVFVVTGTMVFAEQLGGPPWVAIVLATLLGILGKVGGSYAGARLGGESHWTGLRLGALMNTRGLTELVVLQAGYSAGILTPALYLALVVMALVTTAMTGPLYSLIERHRTSHQIPALEEALW